MCWAISPRPVSKEVLEFRTEFTADLLKCPNLFKQAYLNTSKKNTK